MASQDEVKLTPEQKYDIITRNLQEIIGDEKLKELLKSKDPIVYWGTAPTGRPHIGYFVPMTKLGDFLQAGCKVIILIADLHAVLDSQKSSLELVKYRAEYYKSLIKSMLKSLHGEKIIDKLEFVMGRDFQLKEDYTLDAYKLSCVVSMKDALRAGTDVVKQSENPPLSSLIYPGLQALDEVYLKVDAQFGGVDQRKIFAYARDNLPQIGYTEKRIHLMNPMVPGLQGGKMNSSDGKDSKIDMLDSQDEVKRKLKSAFCEPGKVEDNGVLAFCKHVLFPLKPDGFEVKRDEKHGGNLLFKQYSEMEEAYAKQELHPKDLKNATEAYLFELMEPVRKEFSSKELQELVAKAYPPTA